VRRRRHHRHSVSRIQIDHSFLTDIYSNPSLSGVERRKTAGMYVEAVNHGLPRMHPQTARQFRRRVEFRARADSWLVKVATASRVLIPTQGPVLAA
jgi:hypothetical protein